MAQTSVAHIEARSALPRLPTPGGGTVALEPPRPPSQVLFAGYVLDRDDRSLWRGEQRVAIPPKEWGLLELLTRRAGRLVEKDEILASVWSGTHVSDAVVKVCVRKLRQILGDDAAAPRFIETAARRGYRFVAAVRVCGETREDPLASSIDHVASAQGPGMDLRAVVSRSLELAGEAGRAARHSEAMQHLRSALKTTLLLAPQERGLVHDLRLRMSEAAHRGGHEMEVRAVLLEALADARADDDGERFATAVLTLGAGHQSVLRADRGYVDLLEEARTRLSPRQTALRACLEARLAYAQARLPGREARTRQLLHSSRLLGRPHRTIAQEAFVLRYRLWASWGPRDLRFRLAGSRRLERYGNHLDDLYIRLYALGMRTASALEAGDAGLYEKSRLRYLELAEGCGSPWIEWNALRFRVVHATLTGQFDEAQARIQRGVELARSLNHADVLVLLYGQRIMLSVYQDRTRDVLPILDAGLGEGASAASWRCVRAYAQARAGDPACARELVAALSSGHFEALPRDSGWLGCMTLLADTCVLLRNRRTAREIYAALLPHENQHAVAYFGFSYLGPVHGALGRLARLLGRREAGRRHLALADLMLERLGAYSYQKRIPELMGPGC